MSCLGLPVICKCAGDKPAGGLSMNFRYSVYHLPETKGTFKSSLVGGQATGTQNNEGVE